MLRLLAASLCLLALPASTAAADVRLRGLDPVELLFAASGPDRLLAGDLVVAASTEHVFGWPVTGGPSRRLGRLPDLGPATNDIPDGGGFVRIEAAQPGRVVVVRGEGRAIGPEPETGPGHHVVVGPPEGPFTDPAGCGERSGGPAGLSGDLLAYVAAPAADPPCAAGVAPAVSGPAVVVRDLAAGAGVTRVIPLAFDGSVVALRFEGPFVALELRQAPEDPDEEPEQPPSRALVVLDVRTGGEVTRVPVRGEVPWDIGPDGTLLHGRDRLRGRSPTCIGRAERVRLHAPGDAAGRALAVVPCALPTPELRAGGVLRLSLPRPDGRVRLVDRRLDGTPDRELGVVAGPLAGGDDRHLVVTDATCRTSDARLIAVDGSAPARPAGPRTCPVRVRAPRVARGGGRLAVRVTCPRGCRATVDLQVHRPADQTTFGFQTTVVPAPGRSRTVRFRLPRRMAVGRPSRGKLVVSSPGPVAPRIVTRRITVRPALGAPGPR